MRPGSAISCAGFLSYTSARCMGAVVVHGGGCGACGGCGAWRRLWRMGDVAAWVCTGPAALQLPGFKALEEACTCNFSLIYSCHPASPCMEDGGMQSLTVLAYSLISLQASVILCIVYRMRIVALEDARLLAFGWQNLMDLCGPSGNTHPAPPPARPGDTCCFCQM